MKALVPEAAEDHYVASPTEFINIDLILILIFISKWAALLKEFINMSINNKDFIVFVIKLLF
jgi:hypothetical protein